MGEPTIVVRGVLVVIAITVVQLGCGGRVAAGVPQPPSQPHAGPGGAEYRHGRVTQSRHGSGATEFWLYEPADPQPQSAPIVIFNHGWGGMNPRAYGAWIEHITRRGNIVIFPRYQADLRTPPREFVGNAVKAIDAALHLLREPGHVHPELDHVAVVGHSAGGQLAASLAAVAQSAGLPAPKAVMAVEPGKSQNRWERAVIPLEDLRRVASDTLLLVVVGDRDRLAGDYDARRIYTETTAVPPTNKDFIEIVSDEHGSPALVANHFAPCAGDHDYGAASADAATPSRSLGPSRRRLALPQRLRERIARRTAARSDEQQEREAKSVNALDFYGYWKLFDALCDAAFYGKNREYALGNTPAQRYMGTWSDGSPVKELRVGLPGDAAAAAGSGDAARH